MGAESCCGLMTITHDENRRALEIAFARLGETEERYHEQTIPHIPLGRPRIFRVTRFYWPVIGKAPGSLIAGRLGRRPWAPVVMIDTKIADNDIDAEKLRRWVKGASGVEQTSSSYFEAIEEILSWTGNQPRRVWRAIRQINAIAAWCEKRAEGRKRAAEEILRQQSPWINKIASEVLVEELASGTKTEKQPTGSFRGGLK